MLEEIKYFVTVVHCESFTLAAETLDTSRSVVSKKISALENDLGVRLLNRTTRRLSLTEAGELFYQHSRVGLRQIDEAVEEVCSLHNEPRGRLFINLPMSFGILHVAPLIPEFLKRYPNIEVDLNLDDKKVDVIESGFDISIRISKLADSSLAARRLCPCHHVVVACPNYLEEFGKPTTPSELAVGHTIASYRLQESYQEWIFKNDLGEKLSVQLPATVVANNSLALKAIVLSGGALARMPSFLIGPELAEGKLVNLFPDWNTLHLGIYAVFPKRESMPRKTRAFIEFLVEKISDPPWWDKHL